MTPDPSISWRSILENHTRNAADLEEGQEKLARYAAREATRAERLTEVLGDVVATIDTNLGKDAEIDEFLSHIKTFILHGINEANQLGFKAQRSNDTGPTH